MSPTATSRVRGKDSPAEEFTPVLNAAVGGAAARLGKKVDRWTDKLQGLVEVNAVRRS